MVQQQERHVIIGVTAGVPVHGCYQGVQCLVAIGCAKRSCDRVCWKEVSVLVAAFDQPVGVEQQLITGRPARGEPGEVILKAERQGGRPVGQRLQVAAVVQERRVMTAVDNGQLAGGGDLCQRRGDEVLRAQVRRDGPADLARHLFDGEHGDGAAPEGAEHVSGKQDSIQPLAADVADDHPDPMPGGDDHIQIPADRGGLSETHPRGLLRISI